MTFWKSSIKDNVKNGTVLGGLMGVGIVCGERIMNYLGNNFPKDYMYLGDYSVMVYLILVGLLAGYVIDKY